MSIDKRQFGILPSGEKVDLYTLKNVHGMELRVLTYGLRIQALLAADKNGVFGDVVLGYDTLENYLGADYQGCIVGRYANRIAGGKFEIDGTVYQLAQNDGVNSLHGGPGGYHQVLWDVEAVADGESPSIQFSHTSPDGDENYPGTLDIKVTYTLTAQDEVQLSYEAVSDKATPFNPTNHSFFNLSGDHGKTVCDTVLKINAAHVTAIHDDLIPTGELLPVKGTGLDFTMGKKLGDDMFSQEHSIALCGGFDHNFCVDGSGMRLHAVATHPESGRTMEVYSDLPGIQLYTFNNGNGKNGKNGIPMGDHTAFCLETQFYPDSVNHKNFPFIFLQPGVPFRTTTIYKFI